MQKPTPILKLKYLPALNNYKTYLIIGIFVGLFVFIFQPFGIQYFESAYKSLILLGYGLVVFLSSFLPLFLLKNTFPGWLKEQNWTIGKQLRLSFLIILSVSSGIFFYSVFFRIYSTISFQGFLHFFLYTLIMSVFPITGTIWLTRIVSLKKELAELKEYPNLSMSEAKGSESFRLYAENESKWVDVELSSFLYAESSANYVKIGHYQEGEMVFTQLRNTLENISKQVTNFPSLMRVHRAFLLNLYQVESIRGNSKKVKATLKNQAIEIPISRNKIQAVRERLHQLSS